MKACGSAAGESSGKPPLHGMSSMGSRSLLMSLKTPLVKDDTRSFTNGSLAREFLSDNRSLALQVPSETFPARRSMS